MKHLIISTILITSSFFTLANDNVFKSEQWKEIKIDSNSYWANLELTCTEKFPGSRPPTSSDVFAFKEEFKSKNQQPQLYTFLRETLGFVDSRNPKIQSVFELNGKYEAITLPFYSDDEYSYHNRSYLFSIVSNEENELTAQILGVNDSIIQLAPSLGEIKTFCILENKQIL